MTMDVISLSISVLLLFRHYISHKITFGAPSSGGVLCSACGAFITKCCMVGCSIQNICAISTQIESSICKLVEQKLIYVT